MVGLIIAVIILAILVGILWMRPQPVTPLRPTTLLLNPINNMVPGDSFAISGRLVDAITGEAIGQSISFDGTGTDNIPDLVRTNSINITDAGGVSISYCPTPTCTPDNQWNFGNRILHLNQGATIDLPTKATTNAVDIRQVAMTLQNMGNATIDVEVRETNGNIFTASSAGNAIDLVYFTVFSPVGLEQIRITNIGSGASTVGISKMITSDPAAGVFHKIDFEDLNPSSYQSPLLLASGTFYAIGDAPSSYSDAEFTVEASFVGDSIFQASRSGVETFTLMNDTTGVLGESGAVIVGDTGTGVTTIDCSMQDPDTDEDGICDDWELNGVPYTAANGFQGRYVLDSADPYRKDIYVEMDYMEYHEPDQALVLEPVIAAFNDAPLINPTAANPDPTVPTGIALHMGKDERITPHSDLLQIWTDTASEDAAEGANPVADDFHDLKEQKFGTSQERSLAQSDPNKDKIIWAKKQVYHYGVFVHTIGQSDATDCGPSGLSETPGNDFIVSLGCNFNNNVAGHTGTNPSNLPYTVGTTNQQIGTLMHELGHNLGLNHGGPLTNGGVAVPSGQYTNNCKPNYASVMTYSRQFSTYFDQNNPVIPWIPDYSSDVLPTLNENNLNEDAGLQGTIVEDIAYATPGMTPSKRFGSTFINPPSTDINWDGDATPNESTTSKNINNFGITNCNSGTLSTSLIGYNDWNNLDYNFRPGAGGPIDGIYLDWDDLPQEINGSIVKQMEGNCPSIPLVAATVGDHVSLEFALSAPNLNVTMKIAQIPANGTIMDDEDPDTDDAADMLTYDMVSNTYSITWNTPGLTDGTWAIRLYTAYGTQQQSLLDCDGDGTSALAKLDL